MSLREAIDKTQNPAHAAGFWRQIAVGAGAREMMPPTDMFWGDRLGKVTDPFGHVWDIATHIADSTPEEMEVGRNAMFS